jgi:hypothetical protein
MKPARATFFFCLALAATARGAEDFVDQLGEVLSVTSAQGGAGARLSGTLDLEGYFLPSPAPGLIYTEGHSLFNPRLSLFLDAQLGARLYLFAQGRLDRGFDPSDAGLRGRLDEVALRFTPMPDTRLSLQAGKFATVVGNWVPRHGSWENPFVTAPLPYENLTGIWDLAAARTLGILLAWSHVVPTHVTEYGDKFERSPIIWGPSYASGFALLGEAGQLSYAVEVKNASLAGKPDSWAPDGASWAHPTLSARLGYRPNVMWNLGLSASSGSYLRPAAAPTMTAGFGLGDYREQVLAQDASFAWHYWQVWVEAFEARFAIPRVGDADTFSYYTEVKYKFTPQFFGAVRWNQQTFGTLARTDGSRVQWGRDTWRIDVAPSYRLTPHLQLKLQYSLLHEDGAARMPSHTVALQVTARF